MLRWWAMAVAAVPLLASCALLPAGDRDTPVIPDPRGEVTITLYFADPQGAVLVGEQRQVTAASGTVALAAVQALIAGPRTPHLAPTLPAETKVLGVRVLDGTAFVNFSRELIDRHWGGSAGEINTVRSVVYTLTQLDGIDRVQFLIEGVVPPETLLGHLDAREPFEPDVAAGTLVYDAGRLAWLQEEADSGRQSWRLDPLQVLLRDGPGAGLSVTVDDVHGDTSATGPDSGRFVVECRGRTWTVLLIQPVRAGAEGIWVLTEITPADGH